MADIQVTCISRRPSDNSHEGITHLGNNAGKWPCDRTIGWIESGVNTFFVMTSGTRGDIGVVSGKNGKYLRIRAGGQWNDNLLLLPECP